MHVDGAADADLNFVAIQVEFGDSVAGEDVVPLVSRLELPDEVDLAGQDNRTGDGQDDGRDRRCDAKHVVIPFPRDFQISSDPNRRDYPVRSRKSEKNSELPGERTESLLATWPWRFRAEVVSPPP